MNEHHHTHENKITDREEMLALLEYMVKHNASHTEELLQLEEYIYAENEEACASLIRAVEEYKKGNQHLEEALRLIK